MRTVEVVHVKWIDSEAFNDWCPITEMPNTFTTIHTIGMLIHQSSDMYLISSTYDVEVDSINASIAIPAKCVLSLYTITSVDLED